VLNVFFSVAFPVCYLLTTGSLKNSYSSARNCSQPCNKGANSRLTEMTADMELGESESTDQRVTPHRDVKQLEPLTNVPFLGLLVPKRGVLSVFSSRRALP